MGDKELTRGMAIIFLDSAPKYIVAIRSALAAHDMAALRKTAHKLKGSVANMALSPLSETAHRMESIAGAGDIEKAGQLLPTLEEHIEKAIAEINKLLLSLKSEDAV
jgi:HPt (histidine-containing phosphotransfer) domain-containing protein